MSIKHLTFIFISSVLLPVSVFSQVQFNPAIGNAIELPDARLGEQSEIRYNALNGGREVYVVAAMIEEGVFFADPPIFELQPGQAVDWRLIFEPAQAGIARTVMTLAIISPDGAGEMRDVQLSGRGIDAEPELVIRPWPVEISLVVDEEDGRDSESINVENAGEAALEFRLSEAIRWLTISPRQVELEPGDDADIEFSTTGDLPENGRYQGVVQGFSNDPEWEELEIEVELVVDIHVVSSQIISLANGWNMISSNHDFEQRFIDDDGPDMQLILADIIDHVFLIKNGRGRFCAPRIPFWGIDFWNSAEAYWIRVTSDVELEIVGPEIPFDREIHLAAGWSMISYYPNYDLTAQQAFADLNERDLLYIAKNGRGRFIYGELLDFDITPGDGFQVRVLEDCSFTYPPEPEEDVVASADTSRLSHFREPVYTDNNMSLLILDISGIDLAEGAEIACVTTSDLVAGAEPLTDAGPPWGMAVWGDDPSTEELDGFLPDEEMRLVYWDPVNEWELDIELDVQGGREFRYEVQGLLELGITVGISDPAEKTPSDFQFEGVYPNPFNDRAQVTFAVEQHGFVTLGLYDTAGRLKYRLLNGIVSSGTHVISLDSDGLPSGEYILALQKQDRRLVRKIVLLR